VSERLSGAELPAARLNHTRSVDCFVGASWLSLVLYTMKHADDALLTTSYFILGHIILSVLASYLSELSPVIFVSKGHFYLMTM